LIATGHNCEIVGQSAQNAEDWRAHGPDITPKTLHRCNKLCRFCHKRAQRTDTREQPPQATVGATCPERVGTRKSKDPPMKKLLIVSSSAVAIALGLAAPAMAQGYTNEDTGLYVEGG
jgi:hypothetical protein